MNAAVTGVSTFVSNLTFEEIDTNHDGVIDEHELERMKCKVATGLSPPRRSQRPDYGAISDSLSLETISEGNSMHRGVSQETLDLIVESNETNRSAERRLPSGFKAQVADLRASSRK